MNKFIKPLIYSIIIQIIFSVDDSAILFELIKVASLLCFIYMTEQEDRFLLFLTLLGNQRTLTIDIIPFSLINILLIQCLIDEMKKFDRESIRKIINPTAAFIIVSAFLTLINNDIVTIIKAIQASMIIVVVVYKFKNKGGMYSYKDYALALSLGMVTAGLLGLLFEPSFKLGTLYRLSGGLKNNPNDFSVSLIMSITILLSSSVENKRFNMNLLDIAIIISMLILGILTQSRTFILGLILILMFNINIFIGHLKIKKLNLKKNSFIILPLLLIVILLNNQIYLFIKPLISRMERSDLSGGRFEIWKEYSNFLFSNIKHLLFGIGYNFSKLNKMGIDNTAHNFIIELIVNTGIIGFIFATNLFYSIARVFDQTDKGFNIKYSVFILIILYLTRHNPLNITFITFFIFSVSIKEERNQF